MTRLPDMNQNPPDQKEVLCLDCGKVTDGSERCYPHELENSLRLVTLQRDNAVRRVKALEGLAERDRLAFGKMMEDIRRLNLILPPSARIETRTGYDAIDDNHVTTTGRTNE